MNDFKITKNKEIAEGVYRISIVAPLIAKRRLPGQFVILRLSEDGERFPLTIVDSDLTDGTIDIIVQAVGKNTIKLCRMHAGETILDVAGPLGNPTKLADFGRCVVVGGGVGIAPLLPIAKGLKGYANSVTSILGARSKDILILEDEFRALSDELLIVTDDGSYGSKGFVTDVLLNELEKDERPDFVLTVGPVVMMEAVAELTRKFGVKTVVSLNPIMIDGTGMCGGCRCTIDGKVKYACVDGPEFDGHLVDFKGLRRRLSMFKDQELKVREHFEKGCRLDG